MDVLLGQWPFILFLVFYYFYGARLVGTLLAAALRPLKGIEARPLYWEGGIAILFIGLGLWGGERLWERADALALVFMGAFAAIGVFMLFDWASRRLWLEGDVLKAEALGARALSLPLSAIAEARLGGGGSLILERADGAPAVRAPLSMDGLDTLYAALVRAGVRGPAFETFQTARQKLRRR